MNVYLIKRGDLLLDTATTAQDAMDALRDRHGARIVVRSGVRPWWLMPVDWRLLAA